MGPLSLKCAFKTITEEMCPLCLALDVGQVTSRGGKPGLNNKPIFQQPLCLSEQHDHGEEPEAHASGAYLLWIARPSCIGPGDHKLTLSLPSANGQKVENDLDTREGQTVEGRCGQFFFFAEDGCRTSTMIRS